MEAIEAYVDQVIPAYYNLARAIIILAMKDWCGVGVLVHSGNPRKEAQERARYRRSAQAFWASDWARTLCDAVGFNHSALWQALQQADADEVRMREMRRGLRGLSLLGA